MVSVLLVSLLMLLAWPAAAPAATYYVATGGSGTACSQASPCGTILTGLGKLSPGDTLYLRGGSYSEGIHPANGRVPSGTSWANPIIIASAPGETATILEGVTLQDNIDGSFPSYLIFDNLILRSTQRNAFYVGLNAHHIRVSNSDLQSTKTNNISITYTTVGVEVINCNIHNAPVEYVPEWGLSTGTYGLYLNGNYMLVENNKIHDNTGAAVHLYGGTGAASNNIIRNNFIWGNCYSDGTRNQNNNALIIASGGNNQIYNNVVFSNNCGAGVAAVSTAYLQPGMGNNHFYNNTIYGNSGVGLEINTSAPDTQVINNIVYGNWTNNPSQQIVDYGASGTINQYNLTTNPLFVDVNNVLGGGLKVQANSDARNRGTTLSEVATDIEAAVRGQGGAYDIGAYEYNEGGTPPTANGNPIYVRKGAGSPSNDCNAAENPATAKQTIADACQCMTVPGKVMLIEGNGNIYPEEIDTLTCPLTGGNGPAFDTATRLEGYGTTLPVLQSPVATSSITLWLRNVNDKFLVFKKLTIDAASRAGEAVLIASPAHHIRFDTVHLTGSLYESALLIGVSNIEMIDTFLTGAGSNGLGLAQGFDTFLCQRCHLFSNGAKGLDVRDTGTRTNITLRETEIRNNGAEGVDLGASTGTVLQNLLVHSNGSIGLRIRGGSASTKVYNNTVYNNTGNGIQCDPGATSTDIKNNIVYANAGGGANNLVNNCSATVATNLTTPAPMFVNAPTDLKLKDGSPAIDQGTTLASVTIDYDGAPRPQGAQDIGAYERAQGTPPMAPGPGVLRVSTSNPRYMENPAGELVYLTGAYSWNFASTMPDAEVTAYLNYVVAHNQNYIRAPSQDYSGTAQSTSYFTILAARVQQAAALGIYVGVNIFPFTDAPFNSQSFNDAYARDLVQAVGSASNVLYEVGNELHTVALDGGTLGAFVASMVTAINNEQALQGFTPRRMVGISDFVGPGGIAPAPTVVTFLLNSAADFIGPGWSAVGTDACDPVPDYAGQKVIIVDSDHITPYHCDHTWVWKSLMMGANPSVLDGNAFFPDKVVPDNPDDTVGAALTFDAQERMGDTRTYAIKMHLTQAVPHPELSSTGYALAWPSNEYLVYQPATGAFTVQLPAGPYTVEWFDPTARTTTTTTTTVASTGAISFTSPLDPSHDAVLFLKAGTAQPPGPDVTVLLQDLTQAEGFF